MGEEVANTEVGLVEPVEVDHHYESYSGLSFQVSFEEPFLAMR